MRRHATECSACLHSSCQQLPANLGAAPSPFASPPPSAAALQVTPFTQPYAPPAVATPEAVRCRDDGHCGAAYTIDVVNIQLDVFSK